MSTLILIHVVTGLVGIASGAVAIAGGCFGRRMPRLNATFLLTTAAACASGFVFLPIAGVTSAQIVGFLCASLLAVAAHARYARRLAGDWDQIYAIAAVGALFLNLLIATTQSFQHVGWLRAIAPTQRSPVYVGIKVAMLLAFIATLPVVVSRTRRSASGEIAAARL